MDKPLVVGLDLSLASTGLARVSGGEVELVQRIGAPVDDGSLVSRHRRLTHIADKIDELSAGAALVSVEGPAYMSRTGHQHDRSGLWWIVSDRIISRGIPVAVVPPKSRALYATGNGNASKDMVLAAAVRRYIDINITSNDEADAVIVAAMASRLLGWAVEETMPARNLSALIKVELPKFSAHIVR